MHRPRMALVVQSGYIACGYKEIGQTYPSSLEW